MKPRTSLLVAALACALFLVPLGVRPAEAATVSEDLFATNSEWHRNNPNTPPAPTITINAGDTLNLTIANQDNVTHTFTFPRFSIDDNFPVLTLLQKSIVTSGLDVGKWQFWCRFHSAGTDPENHTGMIGWVEVLPAGGPDTAPPVITHTPPAGPFSVGTAIQISANVTDDVQVGAVMLNYTDVGGTSYNVTMTLQGANYVFLIPAPTAAGNITYFVYAEDTSANWAVSPTRTLAVTTQAPGGGPGGGSGTVWIVLIVLVVLFIGILLYTRMRAGRAKK